MASPRPGWRGFLSLTLSLLAPIPMFLVLVLFWFESRLVIVEAMIAWLAFSIGAIVFGRHGAKESHPLAGVGIAGMVLGIIGLIVWVLYGLPLAWLFSCGEWGCG